MATLPGLPMFGHGQIEGFSEKYGMEFQRAYWDEIPDQYLVERHTREIFPLLRRRYLFAEVQHFLLYDFYTPEGQVDEDVFAYSNREGDDCSLVFYHNRYSDTRGWINASAAYSIKSDQGDERILIQSNLGAGLDLANEADCYVIFRDYVQNLEYIRNCQEIHQRGLYIELGAYHCHVFLNFRQVKDDEQGQYAHLASLLEGRGVPSIDEALKEIDLQPILEPYRALMNANMIGRLIDCRWRSKDSLSGPLQAETLNLTLAQVEQDFVRLLLAIQQFSGSADKEHPSEVPAPDLAKEIQNDLINVLSLPALVYQTDALYPLDPGRSKVYTAALRYLSGGPNEEFNLTNGSPALWGVLFAWIFTRKLGKILKPTDDQELTNTWLDEWLLAKSILSALQESGLNEWSASRGVALVRILVSRDAWYKPILTGEQSLQQTLEAWFADPIIQRFLGVNRYQDHFWFNKESFEELIWWFFTAAVIGRSETETLPSQLAGKADTEHITACYTIVMKLLEAESRSSYQVEKLIEGLLA
jgi:hypothetical protein